MLTIAVLAGLGAVVCLMSSKSAARTTGYVLAGIALIPVFFLVWLWSLVVDKGIPTEEALQAPVRELAAASQNTMSQTTDLTPASLKKKVIILYRFGCPDCERIYADLLQAREEHPNELAFISSRGKVGRQLVERYDISSVPSLLVIDPKGQDKPYTNDLLIDHGQGYIYNEEAIDKAISLLKKGE